MSDQRLLWLLAQAREKSVLLRGTKDEPSPSHWAVLAILLALDAEGRAAITKVELGALVGIKERQVANVLKDLEGEVLAFIKKQPRGGAGKGRAANAYDIRPDATGNVVPATWRREQSIAGNAVPSASPAQQSDAGTALPVARIEEAEFVDNIEPPISTGARAETLNLNIRARSELNPERPESVIFLNGIARRMPSEELAAIVIKAVASPWLDPARYRKLKTMTDRFHAWIDAGADFDRDILPTIRDVCSRYSEPIRSWTFFDEEIRKAIADRRAAKHPLKPIAEEARNDFAPRTAGTVSVSRGKISPGSAHYLRELERAANDERRVESVAGK